MSGRTGGSTARLVARAARPSVRRRGTAGLLEIELLSTAVPARAEGISPPPSQRAPASRPVRESMPPLEVVAPWTPARPTEVPPEVGLDAAVPALEPSPPARAERTQRPSARTAPLVPPVELASPNGPALAWARPTPRPAAPPPRPPEPTNDPASPPAVSAAARAILPAVRGVGNDPDSRLAAGPPPSSSPPVVIDRIEIITPPARPPAADPLASVAGRRAGLSRHGGSR